MNFEEFKQKMDMEDIFKIAEKEAKTRVEKFIKNEFKQSERWTNFDSIYKTFLEAAICREGHDLLIKELIKMSGNNLELLKKFDLL